MHQPPQISSSFRLSRQYRRFLKRGGVLETYRSSLCSRSKQPPHLTETIILADRVHAALVSLSDGASIFTGCDEQEKPLQGNKHSHVFCESNNGLGKGTDGETTHITIYAPMGFESEDQKALKYLNEVWSGDDIRVQLLLLGLG